MLENYKIQIRNFCAVFSKVRENIQIRVREELTYIKQKALRENREKWRMFSL
jgi:hypothetical protein